MNNLISVLILVSLMSFGAKAQEQMPLGDSVGLMRDKFQTLFLNPDQQDASRPLPRDFTEYAYPELERRITKAMEIYQQAVARILNEVEESKRSYQSLNSQLSKEEAEANNVLADQNIAYAAKQRWSNELKNAIRTMVNSVFSEDTFYHASVGYEHSLREGIDSAATVSGNCGSKLCVQLVQLKLRSYLKAIQDNLLRPYTITNLAGAQLLIGENLYAYDRVFGKISGAVTQSRVHDEMPFYPDKNFKPGKKATKLEPSKPDKQGPPRTGGRG